jgi:isoleucyl-tRNA synthetase
LIISVQLDDYYLQIIKEELNIKQVEYRPGETFAQKICRPNARILGPLFGKSIQEIISRAKQ